MAESELSSDRLTNLVEVLRDHARRLPEKEAYRFLLDGDNKTVQWSYGELDREVRAVASALSERSLAGERALLLFPPGLEFIAAFLGCLYQGVIAVPAYPPTSRRTLPRLEAILGDARPALVLTSAEVLAEARALFAVSPELARLEWLAIDGPEAVAERAARAEAWRDPGVTADTVAFLQYTSGSTAAPKGVVVRHGHLMHNQRMIRAGFGHSSAAVIVGWLPLYHDMGLIGNVLQPLYLGARCILMSPLAFLRRPARWLKAISRYRGTTSGGPNFGYELAAQKVSPDERRELDLSSWTLAFNGAEPVRAGTLDRFCEAFAGCGFRREAFFPCYGLAEATLYVSGADPGRAPEVVTVESAALERHRVVAGGEDGEAARRCLVGCGRVGLDERLLIVDPETCEPVAADRVGEIWVAGPSVAGGYWRQAEESERVFGGRTAGGEGPFLRTGDLGFLHADGELVVTGRLKDLVILRGRNHYPQDLEMTSEASHAACRAGGCAAFAVDVGDEERLALVQEVERRFRGEAEEIAATIRQAVSEKHQVHVHAVTLIRAGSLPKTSSGKVRRRHTRELFLAGKLDEVASSVAQSISEVDAAGPDFNREELRLLEAGPRLKALAEYLRYLTARVARQAPDAIDAAAPLTALGLDSLMAVELRNRCEAELGVAPPLAEILDGVSLEELAARLDGPLTAPAAAGDRLPELTPGAGEEASGPLSYGQRALWFLQRLAPESAAYNVAVALEVEAALDVPRLRRALHSLGRRHGALATVFRATDEGPRREVLAEPRLALTVEEAAPAELEERLARAVNAPFDLERDALTRVLVLSLGERRHAVVVVLHHIICDLASLAVLLSELRTLYGLPPERAGEALAPLPVTYGDYVQWQERLLESPAGERLWRYWSERLAGELPVLALPADRPRPPHQGFRGAARRIRFDAGLSAGVRRLAEGHGTTVYTVLLAAFQTLLARYSGQREVLVGTPALGRGRPELEGIVGYFVNPVVMRADLSSRPAFSGLLATVRTSVIEALAHQDFPFALLVERLQPQRDPSRSPIFQAMFSFERSAHLSVADLEAFVLGHGGVELEFAGPARSLPFAQCIAQFDVELVAAELDREIGFSLLYDTDLFDGTTAARFLEHFRLLLRAVVEDPASDVLALPLAGSAERQVLYHEWNDSAARDGSQEAFHRLFEEQTGRAPDRLALACGDAALTYGELNRRANRLARALLARGTAPEERVAVLAERGLDLAGAMLAIFKAGAVYVPLDPRYPDERIRATLEPCGATSLLVGAALRPLAERAAARLAAVPRILELEALRDDPSRSAEDLSFEVSGAGLAYVIFTSGSTGVPKGAMVVHRGMANHLDAKIEDLAITAADRVAQNASQCFDISVWQYLAALQVGGSVVVFPDQVAHDPARLAAAVDATGTTLFETVPSMLRAMLAPPAPDRPSPQPGFAALRWLIPTGEALAPELGRQWLERHGIPLVNAYGPTECSDDVTHAFLYRPPPADALRVPIGRPIRNTRLHVLDPAFTLAPTGAGGELCVGGRGVGRGYLHDPRRTAEVFRPDPFGAERGGRLYRTGDLGRYLPDGQLEFFGRIDHQVKVRGFRVEIGEIETVLSAHPAVREVAVVARQDRLGTARLVAYWVAHRAVPEISKEGLELRRWLAGVLPDYMVPSLFVALRSLPVTATGKVDRKALPEPEGETADGAGAAPLTSTEELVARIWSEVLGLPRVEPEVSFFDLGGHSLLATQVASRIRDLLGIDLELRELFENLTVRSLAALVERRRREDVGVALPALVPLTRDRDPALSFAQERLWFLDQLQPGLVAYNMPAALVLEGQAGTSGIERALAAIVRRHETLRTTFREAGGKPVQVIAPAAAASALPRADLSSLPPAAAAAEARRVAAREADRPFDLSRGPLLRATLVDLGGRKSLLLINLHHIIADGWSLQVLIKEISALSWSFAGGEAPPLAELPVQYADFSAWQRSWLGGELKERLLAYWRERLRSAPASLDLPTDRPRPAAQTFSGASLALGLPAGLLPPLDAQARRHTVTLFMWLLAAFQSVLHRYTGSRDVLVGSPIANRTRTEVEGLIGFFVNTLVLRTVFGGDPRFAELLGQVRETTLGAYVHQDLPFEKLVEELQPQRHLSHSPLFQVIFALQDPPFGGLELPGLTLTPLEPYRREPAKFDLELYVWREGEGLGGQLVYNTDLYDRTTVRRMERHFAAFVESALTSPERPISGLTLLGAGEAHQLLNEANDPASAGPPKATLDELFAAWAPSEAAAVVFEAAVLTYAELDRRSNRLAHHLRALGVGPETPVGLCVERSLDMVMAILGILKAGAAYVPLDPSVPPERLTYILDDALAASEAPVLVTQERFVKLFRRTGEGAPRYRVLRLDADRRSLARERAGSPAVAASGDNLAYVIYTSGSTGRPKGVPVTHANVARLLAMTERWFGFGDRDVWTLFHSYAFDFSVWEIWGALAYGGTLVIVPQVTTRAPDSFYELLVEQRVSVLNQTPSAFRQLVEVARTAGREDLALRRVIFGGEALELAALRPWVARYGDRSPELINMYGITETTVHVTYRAVKSGDLERAGASPVGRPIPDLQVHLLGRRLELLPGGVPGEICVGGAGLARGYLGRAALSAERFVADPFAGTPGGRLYRSGDLARRRRSGELEYLGRIDHQVKVRGFRIELGEIESRLLDHAAVREAVVTVDGDRGTEARSGGARLVAYAVATDPEEPPRLEPLRAFLKESLPEYMIPAALVVLEAMPLGATGKLDRRRLPKPSFDGASALSVPPRTPIEEALAGVFAEVLERTQVGIHEDFFDLGGHSLLATQVVSRVRALFNVDLALARFFEAPTVAGIAARIEATRASGQESPASPLTPQPRERPLPLSFAQERMWFLDQLSPGNPFYNLPVHLWLHGRFSAVVFERVLTEVARRHEVLRTVFSTAEGAPRQLVDAPAPLPMPVVDLAGLAPAVRPSAVDRLSRDEARRPFDLASDWPLRSVLVHESEEEYAVLLTLHHIASDGWSMGLLVREVMALYEAYARGEASPLPELPVQYADYAHWQRSWLSGEVLAGELAYWREQLSDVPPVLELPGDRARPPVLSYRSAELPVRMECGLARSLSLLARQQSSTLFMVLMASFQMLLFRLTGQNRVSVGTPIAGRTRVETESLIGLFVNTLVLCGERRGDPSFQDYLGRVRGQTLEAYRHQDLPFEKLVEDLSPERSLNYSPLFQVMLVLQNAPLQDFELAGLRIHPLAPSTGVLDVDLALSLSEEGEGIAGLLEYSAELFDRSTMDRFWRHYTALLAGLAADPERPLSDLALLGPAERAQVLREWNDHEREGPGERCLDRLFEAQVERRPDSTAVLFADSWLSYGELSARANQVARHLRRRGVGPEVLVGLLMERSLELPVGVWGILKAGGGYLPMDPDYPRERLELMLRDTGVKVVLGQGRLRERLPGGGPSDLICLDEDWREIAGESRARLDSWTAAENLAYVIYTSGSTGRPKGVVNFHGAVANHLTFWTRLVPPGPEPDVLIQISPISFDLSIVELCTVFITGARLVVARPGGHRDPAYVASELVRGRVTTLEAVPAMHQHLLDEPQTGAFAALRLVMAGADVVSPELVKRHYSRMGAGLVNVYGPTETTIDASFWLCPRGELPRGVPIGQAIDNGEIYLVDRRLQPAPVGVPGELVIGGGGVTRGYWKRPGLTAEKFVPHPFNGNRGSRLYRTGDLARTLSDGLIHFIGRVDYQVKVRGFRIELGEIEAALARQDGVRDVAVTAWRASSSNTRLVAYFVASAGAPPPAVEELRDRLRAELPDYMVPSAWVMLDEMPLTSSGKVHRKALPPPDPEALAAAAAGEFVEPTTPLERFLASVFAEVLELEQVSTEASFFDLGGHSLMATQVVVLVQEVLPVQLELRDIFTTPTVAAIAAQIEEARTTLSDAERELMDEILDDFMRMTEEEWEDEEGVPAHTMRA